LLTDKAKTPTKVLASSDRLEVVRVAAGAVPTEVVEI
jgi:hypothetical protein